METVKRHQCPVCGYLGLVEAPKSRSGGGSYEICPSCGFQFGVSDDDTGHTHAEWRERWRAGGMKWSSRGLAQPPEWNPAAQLERVVSSPGRRCSKPPRES